jgi:hypothetical protein
MNMTSEASIRDWLRGNCPHVWLLLNSRARNKLPPGLLEYLSPPSEEQLDRRAPRHLPLPGFPIAQEWQQHAEQEVREGRQHLREADEFVKKLINVCGQTAVEHAYRGDLSGVDTEDKLAELFCEITFCAAVSALSSTRPQLRPPSNRPGRNTHCDIRLQVAGVPVYAEVKRYLDTWLRKEWHPRGKSELGPIDFYRRLQKSRVPVPEQFPEGQVNLVFVFHASFNRHEPLEQALFGWHEDRPRPAKPDSEPPPEAGLFAREEWQDIAGCCRCRVRGSELQLLNIWKNPRANVPLPPQVYSALSRAAM